MFSSLIHKHRVILQSPATRSAFNPFPNKPWFLRVCKSFENTVGKGEISLFPTMFSTCLESDLPFSSNLKLSSAKSFNLEESKICRLGKG